MKEDLDLDKEQLEETSPYEHLELTEYIRAFRSSADRVRWVVFIMTLFAAVIFVATWNGGESWMQHRYVRLRDLQEEVESAPPERQQAIIKAAVGNISSPQELEGMVEKLRDQRVERLLMFDLPWLGISIDFNDIVVFSGLTFVLLFLLLLFSLMRHHENLYLALYKVRRLAKSDRNAARGESKANFLYHALAMAQVLSYPPTLARWGTRRHHSFVQMMLFVPFLLEAYTARTNWVSRGLAKQYGVGAYMPLQIGMCAVLFAFAMLCVVYANAANARWKSAFLHVNGARRYIAPPPWHIWARLSRKERRRPVVDRALLAELTEGAEIRRCSWRARIETVHVTSRLPKESFSFPEQEKFAERIHHEAFQEIASRLGTKQFHAAEHEVLENVLSPDKWRIRIAWTVEYEKKHSSERSPAAPRVIASALLLVALVVRRWW